MSELKRFSRPYLLRQVSRMHGLAKYPMVTQSVTLEMVEAGVNEILRVFDEACVNEEHVEQTITEWLYDQEYFPTPAELRRKAWTIRPRYEPAFTVEEPRYKESAPVAIPDELRELWDKACANVDNQSEMWAAIKRDLRVTDFAKVSWLEIAQSKERLGYELKPHEVEMLRNARGWSKPAAPAEPKIEYLPPPPVRPITAEDIERAKRKHETERLFGDSKE